MVAFSLVNVKIALVLYPHHDQLVDVSGVMDEWVHHVPRAVPGLDELLTII